MRPVICRVAEIGQGDLLPRFHALRVALDQRAQCRFSAGGKVQQMQRALAARRFRRSKRRLLQDYVRVGPTEPERTDAGDAFAVKRGPRHPLAGDFHRQSIPGDVRTRLPEMQVLRNLLMLQGEHHLDQSADARCRFQMADIGLQRANQ